MDYTEFAGQNVRITTINGEEFETFIWGLQFVDETEQEVTEVWTTEYTFKVEDILKIEPLSQEQNGFQSKFRL